MNSTNVTAVVFQTRFGWAHFWVTLALLIPLILCTIVGNVFVVAAILLEKHLQGVSNYLILSLAVADLMVATLPMPISAINEVSEDWWLGNALCDFWICSDVLCCTASILHLVGIALDRYWAVTNAEYIRKRTAKRIGFMITVFWLLSVAISLPARFNITRLKSWIQHSNLAANESIEQWSVPDCGINKEYGYTIFSTVGAFYMPMIFMMGIYARIYLVAKARIRRSTFRKRTNSPHEQLTTITETNQGQKSCHSTKSNWAKSCVCLDCCRRAPQTLATLWTKDTSLKSTIEREKPLPEKQSDQHLNDINGHQAGKIGHPRKSTGSWMKANFVNKEGDVLDMRQELKADHKILPRGHCVNSSVPDSHRGKDATQCHQCLGQIFLGSVEEETKIRFVWNRISHSAPPSVFGTPKLSYSSVSSSFDSSCYTANRSEKSDMAAWSSSCSVEHRAKSTKDRVHQIPRFYTVMKTFIIRKQQQQQQQQASPSSAKEELDSSHIPRLKKTKWTMPKLKSGRTSRSTYRPLPVKSVGRKHSKSCCSPAREKLNMIDGYLEQHMDEDMEDITVNSIVQARSANAVELDNASGGTLHLEARLKSTVGEVTRLATVTAMVKRERLENQRERKAVITLAIITGCFMLCWLPFFIVAVIAPFNDRMRISKVGHGIVLWLGYSNSLLNPIIYTIFSPDFRNAFRKILFGRYYLRYRDR
ncbi:unnamed protein product [Echinostoma caproni]|uniref:G_PROTEIN_RECEP_F1_2 domain-containing protein n=1 Tax=Echinostoma caproni TaxID=27848 RepID=A0A183AJS0_9TREM|nr:unnamed protein product [Echinostoma caproni]